MSFIKGNLPPKHKTNCNCSCFRCSGIAWNKGLKGIHLSPKSEFKKGIHPSFETEIKKGQRLSPKTEFKKGHIAWSKLNKEKMPHDEKHYAWKGENAKYTSKHTWIRRKKGVAEDCEFCKTTQAKRYEWANISGKYLRNLEDYISLCKSCHEKFDNRREVLAP